MATGDPNDWRCTGRPTSRPLRYVYSTLSSSRSSRCRSSPSRSKCSAGVISCECRTFWSGAGRRAGFLMSGSSRGVGFCRGRRGLGANFAPGLCGRNGEFMSCSSYGSTSTFRPCTSYSKNTSWPRSCATSRLGTMRGNAGVASSPAAPGERASRDSAWYSSNPGLATSFRFNSCARAFSLTCGLYSLRTCSPYRRLRSASSYLAISSRRARAFSSRRRRSNRVIR